MFWATESPLCGEVRYWAESLLGLGTVLLVKERHDRAILLTWCIYVGVASYMCMQVYDSDQCQGKQNQHYTQAVSPSRNHPNDLYAADEGLRAETSCIQLLNNLLRIAHKLFAYIEQRSNEPLLLHYPFPSWGGGGGGGYGHSGAQA